MVNSHQNKGQNHVIAKFSHRKKPKTLKNDIFEGILAKNQCWSDLVKFSHMVLTFVLVVIDHAASDENKRIENKPPLSYAPR